MFDAISNVGIVSFSCDDCCLIYLFLQPAIFFFCVVILTVPEVGESRDSDATQVGVCVLAKPVICSLISPICVVAIYMLTLRVNNA